MNDRMQSGRPWHLWLVGLLSLAWNAFGGYDYVMTRQKNAVYLTDMMGSMGVTADQAIAYFDSFPLWVDVCWGLGVWGSVAGALLLLMRSGFAFYAFVLSLIGQLGALAWQIPNPLPGVTDPSTMYGMTAFITLLLVLQIWYSRKMAQNGVLR
jgi:hypothetical protein